MAKKICLDCFKEARPKKTMAGSFLIELILWFFLIIPGLIYTIWRNTSGLKYLCKTCGSDKLVSPKEFSQIQERKKQLA